MGEVFNAEMEKVKKLSGYNKVRASRLLDDMATAYISNQFDGLDKSLYAVKSIRKSLSSQGYTVAEIDDYLLEYSYITKAQVRKLRTQSIYAEDNNYIKEVSIIPAFHTDKCTTDIIIDQLKSKPVLLSALQRGISASNITRDLHVNNSTLLINFYNKHKEIIDN